MPLSIYSLVILAVAFPYPGSAQQSNVETCAPGYEWTVNSQGYTPCKVVAHLEVSCTSPSYAVNALPEGYSYVAPNPTECDCNTVVWTLFSACAVCQSRAYWDWDHWSSGCNQTFMRSYPEALDPGVKVPSWAYLPHDTQPGGLWNETAARLQAASGVESTASPLPSSTTIASITEFTTQREQKTKHSPNNVGAIVGSVVGGVAGLVLAIGIASFILIRRRRQSPPKNIVQEKRYSSTSLIGSPWFEEQDPATFPLTQDYTAHQHQPQRSQFQGYPGAEYQPHPNAMYTSRQQALGYRGMPEV